MYRQVLSGLAQIFNTSVCAAALRYLNSSPGIWTEFSHLFKHSMVTKQ